MFELLKENVVVISALFLLYILESVFPYFEISWKVKTLHAFRNGGMTVFNVVIINLIFIPLLLKTTNTPWGVFNQLGVVWWMELGLTILVLDFMAYSLHFLAHKIPLLWRFHRVHHSDKDMDVTTSGRFHIGEHAISLAVRSVLYASFAMKLEFILIYETVFIVSVLFHHSNIFLTEPIDRVYRLFFTSPNMHKVHHSNIRLDTDSNYTSLFSFWDRMFKTYKIEKNPENIVYGIEGEKEEDTFVGMFVKPFRKQ